MNDLAVTPPRKSKARKLIISDDSDDEFVEFVETKKSTKTVPDKKQQNKEPPKTDNHVKKVDLVNNSGETKILERIDTKYKRDTDNLENEKPSEEKIKETIKTSTKEIGIKEIETDLSMKTRNKVEKDDNKDKPSKLPTQRQRRKLIISDDDDSDLENSSDSEDDFGGKSSKKTVKPPKKQAATSAQSKNQTGTPVQSKNQTATSIQSKNQTVTPAQSKKQTNVPLAPKPALQQTQKPEKPSQSNTMASPILGASKPKLISMPKWTPPARVGARSNDSVSPSGLSNLSPGFRVGLSRNVRVKPLHPNVKMAP